MTDLVDRDGAGGVSAIIGVDEFEPMLAQYRTELTGYCYRMLGSGSEAEDAVQETLLKAWRSIDRFEGRSSVRSWLYRIATNVCFDMLGSRQRRARPMDLGPASPATNALAPPAVESTWIEPVPDRRVIPDGGDPSTVVALRDTIRLAFIAALQHLPAKQRAVLILREVLSWHADEVAALLDTSVASVNSALQRARATLAANSPADTDAYEPLDESQQTLLARYLEAFECYDFDRLAAVLHEDATSSMPPYEMWLRGLPDIFQFFGGPGAACRGSRLIPTIANGSPAFGQYRPSGPGGRHEPWSLQVLEIVDGKIAGMNFFLDHQRLFPLFGLPTTIEP